MLMSAVNVPSGIAFGVTLMPANPVSPFRAMKVDRYVPGGGSNLAGGVVGDVVDEHAPMSTAQTMRGAVKRIDPSRVTTFANTGLFVIDISSVSRSANQQQKRQMGKKRPRMGNS
jgi:hypothetical protein